LIITELGTNILKHAGQGWLLIQSVRADLVFDGSLKLLEPANGELGVDVIAIDKGPGMADAAACLEDGYSTAGSSGTGLGAIVRQSNKFDIYTSTTGSSCGTVIIARVMRDTGHKNGHGQHAFGVAGINVPHEFEEVSGDSWSCRSIDGGINILLADGIGHGQDAHLASRSAIAAFQDVKISAPSLQLDVIHDKLIGTRGAAASLARWDVSHNQFSFCGIGNVSGSIAMGAGSNDAAKVNARKLMTYNGTVGQNVSKVHKDLTYPISRESLLILHSDGIATSWNLDHYPGLAAKPALLIAAVLYRDFSRGRDDASIVVAKFSEE
jgi:anti-sigma regulatory factor (Ser/Thr protein kinase)